MADAINVQPAFAKQIGDVDQVIQFEIRIRKFLKPCRILLVVINGNSGRQVEISGVAARPAEKKQHPALVVEDLHIFKRGVDHVETAILINGGPFGPDETADLIAMEPDGAEPPAIGGEAFDPEVKGIGDKEITGGADRYMGRLEKLAFLADGFN